ncbi:hypothetical protein TRIP_C20166 [Candidatus Zixiibacteriota bacterium]|nr:hypothetical protein TRIP_C20166 [candidate division Zixibacteria bacterium]
MSYITPLAEPLALISGIIVTLVLYYLAHKCRTNKDAFVSDWSEGRYRSRHKLPLLYSIIIIAIIEALLIITR